MKNRLIHSYATTTTKARFAGALLAPWLVLIPAQCMAAATDPVVRTIQLNPSRSAPKRNGRASPMHIVTAPAGGSGFAENGPASIVSTPAGALGLYANPSDANASDSVAKQGGPQIVTADLELVFWGSRWSNATNPSCNDVIAAVKKILAGPYLSQMAQYGYQSINLRGVTFVTAPDPLFNYASGDAGNKVWDLIDQGYFPEPDDPGGRILYMVFMPPGTSPPPGELGAHGDASDRDLADVDYAWFGWVSYGPLDQISKTFSHELVESIADPEPERPAWVMDRSLNGANEIGDLCNNTVDVLDGMDMQAYWSQAYHACALPLGSGRPEVQSINQTWGQITGGTSVIIRGRLFVNVSGVKFGNIPAAYTLDSPFQITATSPRSDTATTVNVSVTTPFGDSIDTARFSYYPVVTSVDPNTGPLLGSQQGPGVMVSGVGLWTPGNRTTITFGFNNSSNVYCYDSTRCSAAVPASTTAGRVDVIVSAGGAPSQPNSTDGYTYVGPTITRIDPSIVPETDRTRVDVYGISLAENMTWKFNGVSITVACFTSTKCELFAPPGTGVGIISVEYGGSKSTIPLTYAKFPTVAGIVPATGLATGGDRVTIVGTNFNPTAGATSVAFGPNTATNVQCSTTQCTVTAPAGTSVVPVIVSVGTLASSKNPTDQFSYIPVITGVSPGSGVTAGGDSVTITGAGLASTQNFPFTPPPTSITFGTNPASSIVCVATKCTANTPAGNGTVPVQAVVDGHPSPPSPAARFTYTGSGISKGWTQWQLPIPYNGTDSMTYDPVRHNVLYVTENLDDSGNSGIDQTWVWDPAAGSWTQQSLQTGPKVTNAPLAFDEARGVAVLFGGVYHVKTGNIGFRTFFDNSTWIWNGTAWSAASPSVKPPARIDASMTYDAAHNRIVLFGGCSDTACKNVLNDTWTWDGANWKQEAPAVSPSARHQGTMAYDPALGKVVLFGGSTNGDILSGGVGDMFAWDGQTWAELHPAAAPPARYGAAMAYSHRDSGMVMFGGTGLAGYLPETWLWNGAVWTKLNVTQGPSVAFYIAGMAYDAALDATALIVNGQLWTWGGE